MLTAIPSRNFATALRLKTYREPQGSPRTRKVPPRGNCINTQRSAVSKRLGRHRRISPRRLIHRYIFLVCVYLNGEEQITQGNHDAQQGPPGNTKVNKFKKEIE